MSQPTLYWQEPIFPWSVTEHDRRFRRIVLLFLLFSLIIGLIVPFLPRPEPVQQELKDVAPRLARLILEKKKVPPPPVAKPKTKKAETKKETPRKKTKPKTRKQAKARQKAERSGLLAMQDELADLRESFNVQQLQQPLRRKAKQAAPESTGNEILTARASKGSGGINNQQLSRATGGGQLSHRSTTNVKSNIGTARSGERRTRSGQAARGEEEIELVFQRNKAAIFSLYNRALRRNPSLQGKVVVELTIRPDGVVSQCRIISSELNNPALEHKLVTRIKLFRFAAKPVPRVTVTYPIDFLPS